MLISKYGRRSAARNGDPGRGRGVSAVEVVEVLQVIHHTAAAQVCGPHIDDRQTREFEGVLFALESQVAVSPDEAHTGRDGAAREIQGGIRIVGDSGLGAVSLCCQRGGTHHRAQNCCNKCLS